MKKFFSLFLVLAMVACMSITVFAEDGATVLSVEVPENTPTYTFHCPASATLEYGNTAKQTVGDIYVTGVANVKETDSIQVVVNYNYLSATEGTCPPIEYQVLINNSNVNNTILYSPKNAGEYGYDSSGYRTSTVEAKVSDWSGAVSGKTYQDTITYTLSIS